MSQKHVELLRESLEMSKTNVQIEIPSLGICGKKGTMSHYFVEAL
jgi:hypothetical protein